MSNVVERFLKYVKYNTQSKEESDTFPSTEGQIVLAKAIKKELEDIGVKNVSLDEKGYLYAVLDSNSKKKLPKVGFIAHVDTSPDMSGLEVKPQIVKNYSGLDLMLNKEENIILSIKEYPEILKYIGQDIITTDGTTLLGADDKAGVAEIVTAIEYLINHPEIEHGKLSFGFTPDEEVGKGADYFDVKKFDADFAYTMDGGAIGELECESFNAAAMKVKIQGRNVHPGYAKGKMVNSMTIAMDLMSLFPKDEIPEKTEGYEGYFHLNTISGNVEETNLHILIRDFDRINFEKRKAQAVGIVNKINEKYGHLVAQADLKDNYYNMKDKINENQTIVDIPMRALKELNITPIMHPIRGGTDGSRLSFMGLPTPNIFAGGENFHGRFEFVPINSLEKAVEVILKIVNICSE